MLKSENPSKKGQKEVFRNEKGWDVYDYENIADAMKAVAIHTEKPMHRFVRWKLVVKDPKKAIEIHKSIHVTDKIQMN